MDLCNGSSSFLCDNIFSIGHYSQTFEPNFFIPARLIGTIGFYHFIPLSLTLTMAGVTR